MTLPLVALFALGAILASFMGVVAARLNTGQSFLAGRSRCDACSAVLSWQDLIPIVSYFSRGGHARCCHTRISFVAVLSECVLGALFVLSYLKVGDSPILIPLLIALSIQLSLVLYDLEHQILPYPLLAAFIGFSALTGFLLAPAAFGETAGIALALASLLLAAHYVSKGRVMGFADAPFVFGCALLAGETAIAGLVFSFWIGALIGIVILLRRPAGSRMGVEVPFAPFLAAGFLLAYFTQWNPFIFSALLP